MTDRLHELQLASSATLPGCVHYNARPRNVDGMTDRRRDKSKDRPVPIPAWWLIQANDKLAHRRWTQAKLVEEAIRLRPPVEDASIDKGSVSRLLSGVRTTWALAEAIRRVLDLPPFEFIAADGDEAWRMARLQQENRSRRGSRTPEQGDAHQELQQLERELQGGGHLRRGEIVLQASDVPSGGKRKVHKVGRTRGDGG
jgi:hypothetical protein